jgi:hypothetical protein
LFHSPQLFEEWARRPPQAAFSNRTTKNETEAQNIEFNYNFDLDTYKILSKYNVDAVTGSRMKNFKSALNGKMPLYKFIGNYILTKIFNLYFNTRFTDAHTGLWMYNLQSLKKIKFNSLDSKFNFDNQLRIQFIKSNKKIIEMPIKTYYRNEKSSFHFIYSIKYLIDIFFNKKL